MSLRRFMLLLTTLIILVLLLVFGTSLALLQQDAEQLQAQEEMALAELNRAFMRQRILVYRDIVKGYAEGRNVRDLLRSPTPEKATQWSKQVRTSLPYVVGAVLISNDGRFLGDPIAQQIGPSCIKDVDRLFAGEQVLQLPVHDNISDSAHFDFTEPVADEAGTRIGMLLISFSVDVLNDGLEHLADGGRALRLLEGNGRQIVTSSNWDNLPGQQLIKVALADTGWELEMKLREPLLLPSFGEVSAVLLSGMAVLIGLMLLFSRILSRRYLTEVENLRDILRAISNGDSAGVLQPASGGSLFPIGGSLAVELAQLDDGHRKLHIKSHTDPLTGLANRRAFDARLTALFGEQHRAREGFCLVLFDLDGFKPINDTHGQGVGDRMLQVLADALRSQVRPTDLVSRWGGDEFAVLLPQMDRGRLDPWLARVRTLFSQAQTGIAELAAAKPCGVSVGFVCVGRGDRTPVDDLLKRADEQLCADKAMRHPEPRHDA